ncbi:aminotransferase family protein [Halosegnis longus]|uniref:Aspartate aminotransferase family protein n=1 Tax=Halosegnis longus TaxID=2216012 RepID=A0AAJ4RA18_9EURY|nr:MULTISPECIES: aminotransferase class III-fold pyridoxal phosphate-dependent enzyme [Halobacteriales]RNJ26936.1 aspartate aminotransferase family protein [Salella cibi]
MSRPNRTPVSPGSEDRAIPHWHSPDAETLDVTDGDGAYIQTADGEEYLDFIAQLYCVNAGHGNERINAAIRDQLDRIAYVSSSKHNDARSALAGRLAAVAPVDDASVFFSVSGSEANEAAMQLARSYQDAPKVLTRWRSYHGGTYGAASLTGDPSTRATVERYAATSGTARFMPPLPECFDADAPEALADQAADHLEWVIRNEGPDSIAALLTEPIGGTSGAYPAPPGYFERVRELCDEYDILLVADEVITGFGRCGDWFGIGTEGVRPDMITFAKGVTSAYVPLAGVVANGALSDHFREEGIAVGQTFAGHPLGCAAGLAAMDEYEDGLIDNVRELAPLLEDRLRELEAEHDAVADVHGRGFHWGVEFRDPATGEPFVDPMVENGDEDNPVAETREYAREHGVLFGGGRPDIQNIISPPLCVDESDIDRAVSVLDNAIGATFE